MRWLDDITDSTDISLSKLGDSEGQRSLVSMWSQRVGHIRATEQGETHNFQEVRTKMLEEKQRLKKQVFLELRTSGQRSSPNSECSY